MARTVNETVSKLHALLSAVPREVDIRVSAVGDEDNTIRLYSVKDGDIIGSCPLINIREDGTIFETRHVGDVKE
jgi:hypothetical protein